MADRGFHRGLSLQTAVCLSCFGCHLDCTDGYDLIQMTPRMVLQFQNFWICDSDCSMLCTTCTDPWPNKQPEQGSRESESEKREREREREREEN